MPVGLNNLNNQWFTQQQVDKTGNGAISREELFQFNQQSAQIPKAMQTNEQALGGKLGQSIDKQGGPAFYDFVSKLDGIEGLSANDMSKLAAQDGNSNEISNNDFNVLADRNIQGFHDRMAGKNLNISA